jgi:enterochelin esterase family protein
MEHMPGNSCSRAALVAALLLPAGAAAQGGAPREPGLVSPEVHADRRVTLRIAAPGADSVRLTGEILDGRPAPAMARDSGGVWSVTVGPLAPDVYTYAFVVDGVHTPDPLNGYLKTGPGGTFAPSSQVEVPGEGPQYYDARPVPHGVVSVVQYDSRSLGVPRRALVYTPPDYHAGRGSYPLVVLMHGIGETEVDWVLTGRANQILDNLIADGRARAMVVVMPLGHARASVGVGPVPNPLPGEPMRGDAFAYAAIQRDLLDDLLPAVERSFRVSRRADQRAIMGLSLGGAQALRIGLNNLDRFRWVAGFSAALVEQDPATGYASLLGSAAAANEQLRMLHLTIGKDDFLLPGNQRFSALLERAGVRHTFEVGEGRHEWRVWRRNLRDVLPLLFQQ